MKSEHDEFYDKWPFPETAASSTEREFQFAIQEHLADPVKLLVNKYLGAQETSKRVLPNAESVLADANGLQILIVSVESNLIRFKDSCLILSHSFDQKCGCYRSVINLTNRILKNITIAKQAESKESSSIYTSYSMQVSDDNSNKLGPRWL